MDIMSIPVTMSIIMSVSLSVSMSMAKHVCTVCLCPVLYVSICVHVYVRVSVRVLPCFFFNKLLCTFSTDKIQGLNWYICEQSFTFQLLGLPDKLTDNFQKLLMSLTGNLRR